jgi:hypothetical protein
VRLSDFGNSGHFIALLGRADDNYIVGDPLAGKLVLSRSALLDKYTFTGFFMQLDRASSPAYFSSRSPRQRQRA